MAGPKCYPYEALLLESCLETTEQVKHTSAGPLEGEPDLHLHASFTYSNMTVSPYTVSHLSKGTSIFLGACCHPQRFSTFHKQSVSKSYSGVPTKYTQKPTSYHLHCCYPSPSRQHLLLDLCNRVLTDLPPRLFWALQLGPPVKKEVCCCC